eukprot:g15470.t1
MQTDSPTANTANPSQAAGSINPDNATPLTPSITATAPGQLKVIKRNGTVVPYTDDKISVAITKAFLAVEGGTAAASPRIREMVKAQTEQITSTFKRRLPSGGTIHIEDIQDQVELALMRTGEHKVARSYVLYREERARLRAERDQIVVPELESPINVVQNDGTSQPLDLIRMRTIISEAFRALGSYIKGTNGKSQGVVPFLKVVNDTAVAVNQGGKRKGAVCAYLESWHLDIEEFLELRKNTGDDRRRTHDMNTANWIPDLFMKRVAEDGEWTLFSPSDVPDLHDLYGKAFEARYNAYEEMTRNGQLKLFRRIKALELWRKMVSMLRATPT